MALRLVVEVDGTTLRLPLTDGEQVVGAHPECGLVIRHPSVSRRHALLRVRAGQVVVEDLGSRNGTRVGGQRIRHSELVPGAVLELGAVRAVLEPVSDDDLEPGVRLGNPAGADPVHGQGAGTTWGSGFLEQFTLERLPRLMTLVSAGEPPAAVAQAAGEAVFGSLPCVAVEVVSADRDAVVFRAARADADGMQAAQAVGGGYELHAWFPGQRFVDVLQPALQVAAGFIALADSNGAGDAAPIATAPAPLTQLPQPETVVPLVREIYSDAARVARGGVSVLILGESGTGKEVLARYVHAASRCSGGPFLALNCASLPRDLLEAELFGIERGVATGVEARPGKFEAADGGSLFLDEIADMAAETQAKILRVLQSGEVFRLGGRDPRRVDVRVIAATNRDVRRMVAAGEFRSDLFHRLAGWVVEVPPLRRRRADIANLAAFFLTRESRRHGVRVAGISRAALQALDSYSWPGNIRQLENEMARAVLFLGDGELLDTARLSNEVRCPEAPGGTTLEATLLQVERDEISRALAASDGNVEVAAGRLGISRATLYRRIKALGLGSQEK